MEQLTSNIEEIIIMAKESRSNFSIKGKYQIVNVTKDISKIGKPYYKLMLRDKTGMIRAVRFVDKEETLKKLTDIYEPGNIIAIEGNYQKKFDLVRIYNEKVLNNSEFNAEDYVTPSKFNVIELREILEDTICSINNEYLTLILKNIFNDKTIREKYNECPSSIGFHHSYKSGNLKHVVSMIKTFNILVKNHEFNTECNIDLIYTGIILHDIGKIKEYRINNDFPVRKPGYGLMGHIYLGTEIVSNFIKEIEDFPPELEKKLLHLILSHHGKKEFGSPVEPQIKEAEILHYLDMLDSKF